MQGGFREPRPRPGVTGWTPTTGLELSGPCMGQKYPYVRSRVHNGAENQVWACRPFWVTRGHPWRQQAEPWAGSHKDRGNPFCFLRGDSLDIARKHRCLLIPSVPSPSTPPVPMSVGFCLSVCFRDSVRGFTLPLPLSLFPGGGGGKGMWGVVS